MHIKQISAHQVLINDTGSVQYHQILSVALPCASLYRVNRAIRCLERLKSDFFILTLSKKPLPLNVRHSAPIPTLQNFLKCSQQFSALFKSAFSQIGNSQIDALAAPEQKT